MATSILRAMEIMAHVEAAERGAPRVFWFMLADGLVDYAFELEAFGNVEPFLVQCCEA